MTTAPHPRGSARGDTRRLRLALTCALLLTAGIPAVRAEDAPPDAPAVAREVPPAPADTATSAPAAPRAPAEDASSARTPGDPLEPMNRAIFSFNEKVDAWVLRPTAVGWDRVVPTPVENALDNAFENIRFPIHLVNNALQGKIDGTGTTIFRFLINSTVGVFGLFDVAKHLGMPRRNADFGQTLGIWGVPSGPYLVWPILGSSSIRDSAGMAVDSYLNITGLLVDWPWLAGQRVLETVNDRALLLDDIDRAREASFDFYVAVRAAYEARRTAAISGRPAGTRKAEEDLYFPDTGEAPAADGTAAPAAPGGTR